MNSDFQGGTGTPVLANKGKSYAWGFNSLHPGGAQVGMCDGATQFTAAAKQYLTLAQPVYIHVQQVAVRP